MAEGKEPKGFSFDDDEDEWMSSKVTGFKFEDDDETPFQGRNLIFISSQAQTDRQYFWDF